jgi:UDP-glucose 4-epimerase
MNRNVLVTGGAGYIGSHVVKELCDQGYPVIVFDNFSLGLHANIDSRVVDVIEGDLLNRDELSKAFSANIGYVMHFAAWKAAGESMDNPSKYAVNNLTGSINLIDTMVDKKVRHIVFSSSAAVYGSPAYLPVDEEHPKNPENYYGYTKLAIEENLRWFSRLKNLRYAALRYFNATGYDVQGKLRGKEKNPANLSPVVMETLAGIRDKMLVFGDDYDTPDGTCIRDYIHVNDLATAHLMAMKHIENKDSNIVVNLGTGKGHSVLEVIKAAEKATGRNVKYDIVGRRAGDPKELVASCDLAYDKLGWKAEYSDLDTIFRSMAKVYL